MPEQRHVDLLEKLLDMYDVLEVVSGCARGADRFGELWAAEMQIPVKEFPANWKMYKKAAGHIRNEEMANYADAVVVFSGGRGSANMVETATNKGLLVFDWREE